MNDETKYFQCPACEQESGMPLRQLHQYILCRCTSCNWEWVLSEIEDLRTPRLGVGDFVESRGYRKGFR
jgi:hypothetical protein